ncbi:ricin-type beta-trefoil lectin domain protein [Streptomyces sp. NBC_00322]|uniref:RICIN domain-containing protein n=1 Tax=Streptomyces sp. NBC_00322 TaxID=2975712 RepID=UPI002E2B495C|nr:RICIN domain-containing protein [Streptomyces sp. NBC_00322]
MTLYNKAIDPSSGNTRWAHLTAGVSQGSRMEVTSAAWENNLFQYQPDWGVTLRPHEPDDGTFQMVSTKTGRCVDTYWDAGPRMDMVYAEACNASRTSQWWYVQPYKNAYMIRQVQNSDADQLKDNCLWWHRGTMWGAGGWPCQASGSDWDEGYGLWWIYDTADPISHRYVNLAAKYAMAHCNKGYTAGSNNSYCKFTAYPNTTEVKSTDQWFCWKSSRNETSVPQTKHYKYTESYAKSILTGENWRVGFEVGIKGNLGGGKNGGEEKSPGKVEVGLTLSGSWEHTYQTVNTWQQTTEEMHDLAVPAYKQAWIKVKPLRQSEKGTWTFSYGDFGQWDYAGDSVLDIPVPTGFGKNTEFDTGEGPVNGPYCGGLPALDEDSLITAASPAVSGKIAGPGSRTDLCVSGFSAKTYPVRIGPCSGWSSGTTPASMIWKKSSTNGLSLVGMNSLAGVNQCLDVQSGSKNNGALVGLWDCGGEPNEQWIIQPDGHLFNPYSRKCLDDYDANTATGAQLVIWDCWDGQNQVWHLPF